jgi:hypothetical protein
MQTLFQLKKLIASAVGAVLALPGIAMAQNVTRGTTQPGSPSTFSAPAAPTISSVPAGSIAIDTSTGIVTDASGTVTGTLPPGTIVIVPSPLGPTIGAGTVLSGVAVPINAAQLSTLFAAFAGSSTNLASLENGLRTRSVVTLTGPGGNATFVPPTGPLPATDVTQALLLSLTQLAALGIAQPTPQQIQASLIGGNVIAASGQSVSLQGVLQLRNRGLDFGQIAQAIAPQSAANTVSTQSQVPADGRINPATSGGAPAAGTRRTFGAGTSVSSSNAVGTQAGTPASGSGGNAGTQGGSSTFSPNGVTQGGTGPRGSPNATGGGGLR